MGRSQVKYRTTHGRGRGRGGGRGGGGEAAGGDEASASSSRRGRGGGGRRPLESNAFRYEERQHEDNEGDENAPDAAAAGQTPHSFRRQFFAGEESVREIGAAPTGAYFQSQTVKQWDAEDDDDPSTKSAVGVLDFNWIGGQLAMVAPSIRYQMDPKYCVDFDFEPPAAASDSEQDEDEQTHEQENTAATGPSPASSSPVQATAPAVVAKPASATDSELDLLLQLSSTTLSVSAQTATSSSTTAALASTRAQTQRRAAASPPGQLEDWLDDVLDM